jgi:single-stranded DNA-binding protein
MSFTKNVIVLMGKVALKEGDSIELKESKGGTKYVTFPIVTDYSYKQGEEWKSRGIFHNIVVFGKDAEHCAAQLKKGSMVGITGELIYDENGRGRREEALLQDRRGARRRVLHRLGKGCHCRWRQQDRCGRPGGGKQTTQAASAADEEIPF